MRFDVPLAAGLGITGLVIGALTVTGLPTTAVEFGLWTLSAVALWIPLALRRSPETAFATLTLAGLVAGVLTGVVQAAFAAALLDNNAAYSASYPGGVSTNVRLGLAGVAVLTGVVWGALVGAVAVGVRKVRARATA